MNNTRCFAVINMVEGHVGGREAATAFGGANRREAPVGTKQTYIFSIPKGMEKQLKHIVQFNIQKAYSI